MIFHRCSRVDPRLRISAFCSHGLRFAAFSRVFSIWPIYPDSALRRQRTVTPSTLVGRWGRECSVPVRLAPVMAHLGSYEEILAHVFHTSVPGSVTLPGGFLTYTESTHQESSQQGRPSRTGYREGGTSEYRTTTLILKVSGQKSELLKRSV